MTNRRSGNHQQRTIRPDRLLYAVAIWAVLAALAILNAVVREGLISPIVGDYWGHVTSTITFLSGLSVVSYFYFGRYIDHSVRELAAIGVMWPTMTILFEFGFGHYVMGNSWDVLTADYNLLAGRVWSFVPLSMAIVPLLFGRIMKEEHSEG